MAELEGVQKSRVWDECKGADRAQTLQRLLDDAKGCCSHSFLRIIGSHWRTLMRSGYKMRKDVQTALPLRKAARQTGRVWMLHSCWAKVGTAEAVGAFSKRWLIYCSFCFHLGRDGRHNYPLQSSPTAKRKSSDAESHTSK